MLIHFTKMHGLGNDFVIIDRIKQSLVLRSAQIQRLSDRHFGIGCDQVLFVEPPIRAEAHFFYRIFNANGQEVEQCGNGLRCAAKFFHSGGFTNQLDLEVDCLAGPQHCRIESDATVSVQMTPPQFDPTVIPFITEKEALCYSLKVDGTNYAVSVLSTGNPHAILVVKNLDAIHLEKIGHALSTHSHFPKGANIGFMQVINRKKIRLRVYERAVGETLACGSNACAAVVSGIRLGLLDTSVEVCFAKGSLYIQWHNPNGPVYMRGSAHTSFIGRFRL